MKIFLLFTWLIMAEYVSAQVVLKKDTSFTVYSAYAKEKKKYPHIEIPSYELPAGVTVTKDVVYRNIGSRQLLADVYAPTIKSRKGYPAVLLIFGGGWKSGNKDHWIPFAEQLAAKGFVAVAVEYRLTPEAPYPAALHDLKAAVRWMRASAQEYNIRSNRIAALGCSAGGQLASLLGTTNKNQQLSGCVYCYSKLSSVQAVVNIDGVLAFRHPESSEGKVAAEWLGGTYDENPTNWIEASPLTQVDKHAAPVLFLNSSNPRFHAGRNDMIEQLNKVGIYSEVHEFPNTPHTFWFFNPWYNDVLAYSIRFLQKVLK